MGKRVQKAGCIPFYRDNQGIIRMYFMTPSDSKFGGDRPQIAKGTVDEGDTVKITAIKEAVEELGLREVNIKHKIYCGRVSGWLYLYLVEIEDPTAFDKPDYETGSTHWMTLPQFEDRGRTMHAEIVRESHRLIEKHYGIENE